MSELVEVEQNEVAPVQQDSSVNMMQVIERMSMNPDVDMNKLEKLLDMQERVMNKNSEREFNTALADMQNSIPTIPMKGKAHNGIKYAKLEDIQKVIAPVLSEYGFSVIFDTDTVDSIKVTAILAHRSGHSIKSSIQLPKDTSGNKNAVQSIGSSLAYGQRYALKSLLNLTIGEIYDDDGHGTSLPQFINQKQFEVLRNLLDTKVCIESGFYKVFGCTSLSDFPANRYDQAVEAMMKKDNKDG